MDSSRQPHGMLVSSAIARLLVNGSTQTQISTMRQPPPSSSPMRQSQLPASPMRQSQLPASPMGQLQLPASPMRQSQLPASPMRQSQLPASPMRQSQLPASPMRQSQLPASPTRQPQLSASPTRQPQLSAGTMGHPIEPEPEEPPLDLSCSGQNTNSVSRQIPNDNPSRKRRSPSPPIGQTPEKRMCRHCPFVAKDNQTLISHYHFHRHMGAVAGSSSTPLEKAPPANSGTSALRALLQPTSKRPPDNVANNSQTASKYLKTIVHNIVKQRSPPSSSGPSSRASSRPLTPAAYNNSNRASPVVTSPACSPRHLSDHLYSDYSRQILTRQRWSDVGRHFPAVKQEQRSPGSEASDYASTEAYDSESGQCFNSPDSSQRLPSPAKVDSSVQCELGHDRGVDSPGGFSSRCDHCGITFDDAVIFSIHMGCHNHKDPFICNVCGRGCENKYAFYTHIMRGHEYQ